MELQIKTANLKVCEEFFNDLSKVDQTKIFMSAYRKAVKPLVEAVKAGSPNVHIYRSIGVIEVPENVAVLVGSKPNTQYPSSKGKIKKVWFGHIFEGGTRMRQTKKGYNRGRIEATNFFENAYDATSDQVYSTIEDEWYKAIESMVVRTNRKMKKI